MAFRPIVMKRTISVPYRPLLFTSRWLAGVVGALTTLAMLYRLHGLTGLTWPLLVVGTAIVLGVGVMITLDVRLRRVLAHVAVDDRLLYVTASGGSKEATIPLTEIVRVTQWRGKRLRPISVDLRSTSSFGTRIRFLPPLERGWAWQEDAIAQELRRLAQLDEERPDLDLSDPSRRTRHT